MTGIMINLSIISGLSFAFIVLISGCLATIFESYIGAIFQSRINCLTNEIVNAIHTTIAAFVAISIFLLFS